MMQKWEWLVLMGPHCECALVDLLLKIGVGISGKLEDPKREGHLLHVVLKAHMMGDRNHDGKGDPCAVSSAAGTQPGMQPFTAQPVSFPGRTLGSRRAIRTPWNLKQAQCDSVGQGS